MGAWAVLKRFDASWGLVQERAAGFGAAVFGVEIEPFAPVWLGGTACAAGTLGLTVPLVQTAKSLTRLCLDEVKAGCRALEPEINPWHGLARFSASFFIWRSVELLPCC